MQGVQAATKRPNRKKDCLMKQKIAFQGAHGAYSEEACQVACPNMATLACKSFDDILAAVRDGQAELAMVPIENSTYGRVADIHRLLPESGLYMVGEAYTRVRISLMVNKGVSLSEIKYAKAHTVLLPQARRFLAKNNIEAISAVDSAGAAAELSRNPSANTCVLASALAAQTYDLEILAQDIEDHDHNTTRFVIMSKSPDFERRGKGKMKTSFIFQVRNIPAALYKAMGGFATNGVNMIKLESYMIGGSFSATQFFADVEGHPEDKNLKNALEELQYFSSKLTILGVYPSA